ncbi:MAG TPA: AAA family ATPase [Egibacteraceae bacterium]|nr:AAA family ATPase [Egibacteraceae bacterium]
MGTAPRLAGRERTLAQLDDVLQRARDGLGELVVVAGEAGIGKSWLAGRAADCARGHGFDVVWTSCHAGTAPAFWPWRQLMRGLPAGARDATAIARLTPTVEAGRGPTVDDPEAARLELFDAVADAVRAACVLRPLLMVIEDIHWADLASLRLLAFLAPALRGLPAALLVTVRSEEAGTDAALGEAVADLARHGTRCDLDGLTVPEIAQLARETVGPELPERVAAALQRHTAGNPLFVREFLRLLHARGELAGFDGQEVGELPPGVRDVLRQRLQHLPADTLDLLEVAATVGETFGLDVVQQTTGLQARELIDRLDPARRANLIGEVAVGRYAFGHALVRAALLDRAGMAGRLRLHERVGEALEAMLEGGATVELSALAHHWLAAAVAGHAQRAVRYAVLAADQALELLAYEQAARLYERALQALALDPTAGDRTELLLAFGEALAAAGDPTRARAVLLDAAGRARDQDRPEQLARAALGLAGGAGGFEVHLFDDEQIELLRDALDRLDPTAASLRARLLARLSVALSYTEPIPVRVGLAEAAVRLARGAGDEHGLAYALAAHCDAIAGPHDSETRQSEADEIIALATSLGDRRLELLGRRLRLVALLETGDVAGSDEEIEAYARTAGTLRQPLYQWYVPLWRGMRCAVRGDLADADRHLAEARAVGRSAGSFNAHVLGLVLSWFLHTERGQAEQAAEDLAETARLIPPDIGAAWWNVHAMRCAQLGQMAEARRHIDRAADVLADTPLDSEWMSTSVVFCDVLLMLGGHPAAPTAYEQLLPYRRRHAVDGIGAMLYGSVERQLGVLAALQGHQDAARRHFTAALAANEPVGALLVARTHLDAARVLRDPDHLQAAHAAYGSLGLLHRVGRLAEEVAPPGPTDAVDTGPPGGNTLRRDGGLWRLTFDGKTVHVPDRKGLHDLARLLAEPGREFHVLDLAVPGSGSGPVPEAGMGAPGDLGPALDATARAAYRRRLSELEDELAEAEAAGDGVRAERARAEHDLLVDQLAGAYGLAGRPRRTGDPAERARSTVTRRIRDAITAVERVHPKLGRHLRSAVRTGTFCRYEPERPTVWQL